ncbi:cytochrome P450 [Nocardioides sediminis]|uniref:cytochrome P450 n=1 Tax=Nocardioides sediminis TaxID=433648 RepID=UPI000D318C12|nr:cytochrome P450 [Nocardioides sediminis]
MDAATYDFPTTVSRSTDLSASTGDTRTGHHVFASLTPDQVERGREVFATEWCLAVRGVDEVQTSPDVVVKHFDAMDLLRRPMARATCAAVLTGLVDERRDEIADLVLAWIDALAPVIASSRAPRRWSRTRRREHRSRTTLEDALGSVRGDCAIVDSPNVVATMLAAGIQVPVAAGAWLLVHLAALPDDDANRDDAVWETLRVSPPTWLTARMTTRPVEVDGHPLPAGALVMVSPLLLGRLSDLAPDAPQDLSTFCPDRWRRDDVRPGAWLPFGAGAHACPGRSLGLGFLRDLATWAGQHAIALTSPVTIDQSRGLVPTPAHITATLREEVDR